MSNMPSPQDAASKMKSDEQIKSENSEALLQKATETRVNKPKSGQGKKPAGKPTGNAGLRAKLDSVSRQLTDLQNRERDRRENTPTVSLNEDSMDITYTGKVAGKPQNRNVPVIQGEKVKLLIPLIKPIVSICNAALRGKQLENLVAAANKDPSSGKKIGVLKDHDDNVLYEPLWMTKANYAYSVILSNPTICEHLRQIGEELEKFYQEHTEPGALSPLPKKEVLASEVRSQSELELFRLAGLTTSPEPNPEGPSNDETPTAPGT